MAVEAVPWRFTEKEKIASSGQGRVPVIVDGGSTVADSWAIAEYLERTYPDRPSLFGRDAGSAHARFINAWADTILLPGIARLIVRDIVDVLDPRDSEYGLLLGFTNLAVDQAVEVMSRLKIALGRPSAPIGRRVVG